MDAIFKILAAVGRQRSIQVVLVVAAYLDIAALNWPKPVRERARGAAGRCL